MTTHPLVRPDPLRAWRFEDLCHTPDDGYRYEIFDGTLLVTPLPALPHAGTVHRLRSTLEEQAPPQWVVGAGLGVMGRDETSFFIPDLVLFDVELLNSSWRPCPRPQRSS